MSTRDDLVDLIELGAVTRHSFGQIADAILKAGWRPPAREITTVEELEALPNNEERAIPQEAVEAACNAFQRPNRMLVNTSDGNLKGRLEAALEAALPAIEKEIRAQIAAEIRVEMRRQDTAQIGFSAIGDAYAHAARIARGKEN